MAVPCSNTVAHCFIGTFIMAHLFAVFFRSHLNTPIFLTHPLRFTAVPPKIEGAGTFTVRAFADLD